MPKLAYSQTRKFLVSSNLTGSPSLMSQTSESGDVQISSEKCTDVQAARDTARIIASERAIFFHKAAAAFKKNQRGTASYYADEVNMRLISKRDM
jgi:hypothetical protein